MFLGAVSDDSWGAALFWCLGVVTRPHPHPLMGTGALLLHNDHVLARRNKASLFGRLAMAVESGALSVSATPTMKPSVTSSAMSSRRSLCWTAETVGFGSDLGVLTAPPSVLPAWHPPQETAPDRMDLIQSQEQTLSTLKHFKHQNNLRGPSVLKYTLWVRLDNRRVIPCMHFVQKLYCFHLTTFLICSSSHSLVSSRLLLILGTKTLRASSASRDFRLLLTWFVSASPQSCCSTWLQM